MVRNAISSGTSFVALAVEQADRAVDRDLVAEQEQLLAQISRRPGQSASSLELRRRSAKPHSVKSGAAAIPTSAATRSGRSMARWSAIQPPIDEPTRISGPSSAGRRRERFLQPQRQRAVLEAAAARAGARIVEPQHCDVRAARRTPPARAPSRLPCPRHSREGTPGLVTSRFALDRRCGSRRLRYMRSRSGP